MSLGSGGESVTAERGNLGSREDSIPSNIPHERRSSISVRRRMVGLDNDEIGKEGCTRKN